MPHALLASPAVYARRLLFALCRFFAPRTPMDRPTGGIFTLLHQPPRDPPDPACIAAATATNSTVEEIVRSELTLCPSWIVDAFPHFCGVEQQYSQFTYPVVSCLRSFQF